MPITAARGEDKRRARGCASGEERAVNSRTAFAPREAIIRGLTSTSERGGKREKIQTVTTIEIQHPKNVLSALNGNGIGCCV